jgi:hypothetical protein
LDAADICGITPEALRQRLHRARETLSTLPGPRLAYVVSGFSRTNTSVDFLEGATDVFGLRLPLRTPETFASLVLCRCRREYLLIPSMASVACTFEADSGITDRVITQNELAS